MSSKKRVIEESEEEESPVKRIKVSDDSDDDDNIPLSELAKMKKVVMRVPAEDSDSDDDIPIAELIRRKNEANQAKLAAENKTRPKSAPAKSAPRAQAPKKVAPISTKRTSSSRDSSQSSERPDKFYISAKGRLVQKLLVRWWYAISWPDDKAVTAPTPAGYEALAGFPGVFVSTSVESMGTILDRRDKASCPSLRNLSIKPAAELKSLCITAIEEQIRQLVEAEGPDRPLEETLRKELRQVKSINTDKADKEYAKLFKQPL